MTKNQLKAERKKLGLTQTQLAQRLKVSLRTVQGWEGGESRIPGMIEPALRAIAQEKPRREKVAG